MSHVTRRVLPRSPAALGWAARTIIAAFNGALHEALADADVNQRLLAQKWAQVIARAGIENHQDGA